MRNRSRITCTISSQKLQWFLKSLTDTQLVKYPHFVWIFPDEYLRKLSTHSHSPKWNSRVSEAMAMAHPCNFWCGHNKIRQEGHRDWVKGYKIKNSSKFLLHLLSLKHFHYTFIMKNCIDLHINVLHFSRCPLCSHTTEYSPWHTLNLLDSAIKWKFEWEEKETGGIQWLPLFSSMPWILNP